MSIKQQLSEFYDEQGLTGKHRRKAMQWDMKAARRNAWFPDSQRLQGMFSFTHTPEGHNYWAVRAYPWYRCLPAAV